MAKPKPQMTASKSVEEYLANVPEPARTTLNKIRASIRSAAPREAVETISYGIPTFKHKRALVAFAAFSKHCSFFPMSLSAIEAFRDELKRFDTSKGTIRFPLDKPLPASLVKRIVRLRLVQNEEKEQKKRR